MQTSSIKWLTKAALGAIIMTLSISHVGYTRPIAEPIGKVVGGLVGHRVSGRVGHFVGKKVGGRVGHFVGKKASEIHHRNTGWLKHF